jgi:hypothetical protein
VIEEGDWYAPEDAYALLSDTPRYRRLRVKFLNHKDLPVTVWGLRVEFYKGDKLLEEWARPHVHLVDESGSISELRQVPLPPYITVPLELLVISLGAHDTDEQQAAKLQELKEADRAVFVATFIGAKEERRELHPPWRS